MLQPGRQWFPQMLQKRQFNHRVRQLGAALVRLQQAVADWLATEVDWYECVDCTEVPICSLSQAASYDRHWLSGQLGRGGNNGGWFDGEQRLLSVTRQGAVTGWLVGLAPVDDRWMLEAFLSTRQGRMQIIGPQQADSSGYKTALVPSMHSFSPAICVGDHRALPNLADQEFNGARWLSHWQHEYQMTVSAVPPANAKQSWDRPAMKWLASHRQIVETVLSRLVEVFGLKQLKAHSDWGKITRLAAKMAAYNLGCYFNRLLGRPDGALATRIL